MEFLRFGSSIPGSYWGCCAVCIIQNFKVDPDAKASIQLVDGDGGSPITNSKGSLFAGPTYRDIFKQRLRIGTFSSRDMPNHAFLAVLTKSQISQGVGKKWLAILKEEGFEFIRAVDNSVYSGDSLISAPGEGNTSAHPNYLFGLFRNIGNGAISNPYEPPKEWTDLPQVVPEAWMSVTDGEALNLVAQPIQLDLYNRLGKPTFLSEDEVVAAGAPVWLAGQRSPSPQRKKPEETAKTKKAVAASSPFTHPVPDLPTGVEGVLVTDDDLSF